MRYQLAVAVKEEEYARRLADYVRTSPFGEEWQLTAFTHPETFVNFLQNGYPVDLIAAQPEMLKAAAASLPEGVPAVALVGKPGAGTERPELLQFQPLPELLRRLAAFHAAGGGSVSRTNGDGRTVVTVYSAAGGTGKTTLALHLAQAAGARNQRAFYLNLEKWSAAELRLGAAKEGAEGLSQLLYCIQSKPDKAAEWMAKHRIRHPVWKCDYILPCSNPEDRLTLSASDGTSLIDAILQAGYDYVVVESDDGMEELQLALFEKSDRVVCLLTEEPSVPYKNKLALQYGGQKWADRFQKMKRKIEYVVNGGAGRTSAPGGFRLRSRLPEVKEWRSPGAESAPVSGSDSPLYRAAVDRLVTEWAKEGEERHAGR